MSKKKGTNSGYRNYLNSMEWKELRARKILEQQNTCELSERTLSNGSLQAHHLIYRTPLSDCRLSDLMLLCVFVHDLVEHWKKSADLYKNIWTPEERRVVTFQKWKEWIASGRPGTELVHVAVRGWMDGKLSKKIIVSDRPKSAPNQTVESIVSKQNKQRNKWRRRNHKKRETREAYGGRLPTRAEVQRAWERIPKSQRKEIKKMCNKQNVALLSPRGMLLWNPPEHLLVSDLDSQLTQAIRMDRS